MFYFLLAAAENTQKPDPTGTYIIMGVIVLAIIGLFVYQTIAGKKKQKEAQEMVNSLKVGDKIKTIGGVCGYLVEVNDAEGTIVIETGSEGNTCHIKFDKGAIYQTGSKASAAPVEEKVEAPVAETNETAPEASVEEVKEAATENKE